MNSEFDKELDWLLRGQKEAAARRGGASPASPDSSRQASASTEQGNGHDAAARGGAHLDADELGAFAEGALPAQTRLRYASHLADCDHCRRLATSLTLAANRVSELEKSGAQGATTAAAARVASPSWRAWLASIFKPQVLRYAVPALAIALAGVLALVVLRERRAGDSVALVSERQEGAALPPSQTQNSAEPQSEAALQQDVANANTATTGTLDAQAPEANAEAVRSLPAEPDKSLRQPVGPVGTVTTITGADEDAPPPPAPETSGFTGPPAATAPARASASTNQTRSEDQSLDRTAVAENRPSISAIEAGNRSNRGELARTSPNASASERKIEDLPINGRQPNLQLGSQQGKDAEQDKAAARNRNETTAKEREQAPSSAPVARRRSAAPKAAPMVADSNRDGSGSRRQDAETRSISGRRFRREGSAWVDTAYRSSQSTTNVRRGTEQFRALVADEPELRNIANQLGGEVVVVWRGRAYRIR